MMAGLNANHREISFNEGSSLNVCSAQNLTASKTKFKPIRIKALLDQWESEDDDSEERPRESDDESDTEDFQPLPRDEDIGRRPELEERVGANDAEGPSCEKREEKLQDGCENVFIKDYKRQELRLDGPKFLQYASGDSGGVNGTMEAKLHNGHRSSCFEIKPHDHRDQSQNVRSRLISQSSSPRSGAPMEAPQTVYQKNPTVGVKFESSDRGAKNGDAGGYEKNLVPQASTDVPLSMVYNRQGPDPRKIATMGLENMPATIERRTHSQDAFKLENNPEFSYPAQFGTQTPMKHIPVGHMRPTPSLCHRSLMQTPQTNSHNEIPRNNVQTPATIFSHWSVGNMFQTPTSSSVLKSRDCAPTSAQPMQGIQNFGLTTPRYPDRGSRSVRRPLAEAVHPSQGSCPQASSSKSKENINPNVSEETLEKQNPIRTNHMGYKDTLISENGCFLELHENPSRKAIANISDANVNRNELQGNSEVRQTAKARGISEPDEANSKNDKPQTVPKVSEADGFKIKVPSSVAQGKPLEGDENKCEVRSNVQFSMLQRTSTTGYGEKIIVKGKEFIVLGTLGQGMSGEVLRVQNAIDGELLAIKCVNLSLLDKETAQGCIQEVTMLHRLQAPSIITMFEYEIRPPFLYVIMEMGDTDLSSILKSSTDKPRPLTMILYYWTEMLTAVKHIHENGVIHSDLKPANFLLVKGRLKLIDFGIASSMNADMTSVVKHSAIGTMNYISPEALMDIGSGNGSGVDSPNNKYKINYKSDVWSLGCILYSLVYGKTPFEHIRTQWLKLQAITNPNVKIAFPPSSEGRWGAAESPPLFLVDVMRRCLQHEPKARPTVSQLLQIPYVTCGPPPAPVPPDIRLDILTKIKRALTEEEWRQLTEVLERRRPL